MSRPTDPRSPVPTPWGLPGSLAVHPDLALIRLSRDGLIREWSEGASRLLGRPAEAVVGHALGSILREEDRPELARRLAGAGDPVWEWEVELFAPEGSVPCSLRIVAGGAETDAILLVRDRRREVAAERGLRWYRSLVQLHGDETLMLDPGGRIREIGPGWPRPPGSEETSWPGRHAADLFGNDRREVLEALRQTAREGRWSGFLPSPGGRVHLTLQRVRNAEESLEGFVGILVPERKRESTDPFLRLPAGVLLLAGDLSIREVNPEAAGLLEGPPGEELVGLDVRSLAAFQVREVQDALEGLHDGTPFDLAGVRLGGVADRPVTVRLKGERWGEAEQSGFVVMMLASAGTTDVERQLLRAQKMESIGNFASGLAHDFGNFVAVILGKTGVLRVKLPEDPHITRDLDDIETAAKRAQHLAQELMKFARGGRQRVARLDVNRIIDEVGSLIQTSMGKRIAVDLRLAPGLPEVDGDEVELQQLVLNLCLNARDAMPRGGRLTIETRLMAEEQRGRLPGGSGTGVSLVVRDTGVGMPPEILERVFEPFFTTKHEGNKGAGLGLAMVYAIVRRHGGVVDAQSRPGVGSAFEILLPAASATTAAADAGRFALVVDDEPAFAEMVRLILEEEGHRVKLASNGIDALRTVREELGSLSLVILDLRMPGVDGLGVLEELRELAPRLPVLVTTGYAGPEEKAHALTRGARKVLEKPYRIADLKQALEEVLSQGAPPSSGCLPEPRKPSGETHLLR